MNPADDDVFTARDRSKEDAATVSAWGERLERLGHLYRYASLAGEGMIRFERLVLQSEIYFAPFRQLNDPFDGAVQLIFDDATEKQVKDYWVEWFAEEGRVPNKEDDAKIDYFVGHARDPDAHARLQAIHNEEIAKLGVRCFSEPPDDLPMWGYYADSHRGVCLRFRAPLLQGWENCVPPMRVTYEVAYPKASFYLDTRFKRIRATVATKAEVWSHESEWRMIRTPYGVMQFNPDSLDGVIMGCRIEVDAEKRVRAVLARRERRIELLKCHTARDEFRLDIRPAG